MKKIVLIIFLSSIGRSLLIQSPQEQFSQDIHDQVSLSEDNYQNFYYQPQKGYQQEQNLYDQEGSQPTELTPLDKLRNLMQERNIDIYIVPRSDQHNSQWLCACDERVAYLSGFKGTNGLATISKNQAIIWTDGRFVSSAKQQVYSGWNVIKTGQGQIKWYNYIAENYGIGKKIEIDGRLISFRLMNLISKRLISTGMQINITESNLVDQIWTDRPNSSQSEIFLHHKYAGKSISQKIKYLRQKIQQSKAQAALFTDLSEISWILNLKSKQFPYIPVFKSYLVIKIESGTLFLPNNHPSINSKMIKNYLKKQNISIRPYPLIIPQKVICNPKQISYSIGSKIKELISWNGIGMMRAVRTDKQIKGFRKANILDGISMARYWSWLQKQQQINQYQNYIRIFYQVMLILDFTQVLILLNFQIQIYIYPNNQTSGYFGLSFPPIISSGANSAIIHYSPTQYKNSQMLQTTPFFMDYGSQYLFGTTDTARAFQYGQPTPQQKQSFTRVLLGNLDVQRQTWPVGRHNMAPHLDKIARRRLNEIGFDYDHGTGHGIGYFSGVHELPVGITSDNKIIFQQNMIVTNEPGYYQDGKYGFRVQNSLVVVKKSNNNLGVQNISLCPYDKRLFDFSLLSQEDLIYINAYHKKVWQTLSPFLRRPSDKQALNWLKRATQPIST